MLTPFATRPLARALVLLATLALSTAGRGAPPVDKANPFQGFRLPDGWEARFWAAPNGRAFLALTPEAAAKLVPVQAGLRFCRCPACGASETENPLAWEVAHPARLTCRRCGKVVLGGPEVKPAGPAALAKEAKEKTPTEETVEVLPRVVHHYPYVEVPEVDQRYPGERLYLAARADYEAREFLSKAALYSAVRATAGRGDPEAPRLARLAAALLIRFAQVYPAYATHYDQPGAPKFLQQADLPPPYRKGYKTAKWDWSGSLDVPLNLVVAYALLRDGPALAEAGALLGVKGPAGLIEDDLFRASAQFARRQPEEFHEAALQVDRGLLAVGRLLDDPGLVAEAVARLDRFAARGFYHDGFWREGTLASHRRVLDQLDGWIEHLVAGFATAPAGERAEAAAFGKAGSEGLPPLLALSHEASGAVLAVPTAAEVQTVSWPGPGPHTSPRKPQLLGGAGIARLAVGEGADALDLELRGIDTYGPDHIQRQALRVAVAGKIVLDDLDETEGVPSAFERATASHNTVVVDGLNQRESLTAAREPARGGNFLFFAADDDFQVVTLDDPRAYPQSATRYRQTVLASTVGPSRLALSVFEARGGLQHDQFFHGAAGEPARWRLPPGGQAAPSRLLPAGLTYVANASPADGRWFVQAYGEFSGLARSTFAAPAAVSLVRPGGETALRLHALGDVPLTALTALSPGPAEPRSTLLLRRRSEDGSTLNSVFVTAFEPVGPEGTGGRRIGRVASPPGSVVIYAEGPDGGVHFVVNLAPGKRCAVTLADGQALATDGLAVRVTKRELVLAGGTFAESAGRRVAQAAAGGTLRASRRELAGGGRGWFETDAILPDPDMLAGRTLIVTHGDGTSHGWTLLAVENNERGSRLHVREEPGFDIDPTTRAGRFYQFPRTTVPGPHTFRVSRLAR